MKKILTALLLLLVLILSDSIAYATARVTFSIQNRRVAGNVYYAEVWADVSGQWVVSGQTIQLSINTSALQGNSYVGFSVLDADTDLNATPYNAMNYNWYANRASLAVVAGANPPYVTKTGSFRIGTLRFTVLNSALNDNLSFQTGTSGITTWTNTLTPLIYGCNDSTCYQVNNPTPAIISSLPSVGTPTLVSPLNNATAVSMLPQFSWNAVPTATSYTLQVSTTNSFTTTTVNQPSITATNFTLTSSLSAGTLYYWRVNATNGTQTGGWSETRAFTTASAPVPPVPLLSAPANGATGQSTAPTLSWNASTGATSYSVQVSTTNTFYDIYANYSGLSSTSQAISGLANGTTYFWRASATNVNGTSAWSEIWSFTTASATPPSAPTLASPANGATGQSTAPTLSWNASTGATTYSVQVSTTNNFSTIFASYPTVATTSQALSSLATGTTYYWRVSATNTNGTSSWSSVWSFTTSVANPPAAPVLSAPANGATGQSTAPTLSWNASSGATTYSVQVSTTNTFSTIFASYPTVTTTSQALSTLATGTTYYWRVSATNTNGTSSWSNVWSFSTASALPPPTPTLSDPGNNTFGVSVTPTLTWNASAGATSYNLQVSTSNTFTANVVNLSSITQTSQVAAGLSPNTLYYWRVSATNANGTSGWSTIWSFTTTNNEIGSPVPISPENNAVNISLLTSFLWSAVSGATSYTFQLSTSPTFETFHSNQPGITNVSFSVSGMTQNTVYYWRIMATNGTINSAWSAVWTFSTLGNLATPILVSPANGETGVLTNTTLEWNTVANATTYSVQVSTSNQFNNYYFNQNVTSNSCPISGLSNNSTYYWRVRAFNTSNTSVWSAIRSFSTGNGSPQTPSLISPQNGATEVPVSPTLSWSNVSNAQTYNLQVSTNSNFLETITNLTGLQSTNQVISALSANTTYYWRASATNTFGTSAWSATWSFTTLNPGLNSPELSLPSNGATAVAVNTTLAWNSVAGASTYGIQVSTSNQFTSYEFNQTGLSSTSFNAIGLAPSTVYYWRVRASAGANTSAWSAVWSFTTGVQTISAPTLLLPANNATNVSLSPALSWNSVIGGTSYSVQVSLSNQFTSFVHNQSGLTQTTFTAAGLANGATYFWRVRAANATTTSDWSETRSFSTSNGGVPDSWSFTSNTGTNANIGLTPTGTFTIGQRPFQAGDAIGAFFTDGAASKCAGYLVWNGSQFGFVVWGDDALSPIKDGFAIGEEFTFKVWDAVNQVEIPANVTYSSGPTSFQVNGLTVLSAVSATSTSTQNIPLASGWNMISSYINPSDNQITSMLSPIIQNTIIIKNSAGESYWPPYMSNLTSWNPANAYAVKTTTACTLSISGMALQPENTSVFLPTAGWYWIPYYRTNQMAINQALSSISGSYSIVKSITGEAYWPPYMSTLSQLSTGMGYLIYMNRADTLIYPQNSQSAAPPEKVFGSQNGESKQSTGVSLNAAFEFTSEWNGSEVTIFNSIGETIATSVIENGIAAFTVFGDDATTPEIEFARAGEELFARIVEQNGKQRQVSLSQLRDFNTGQEIAELVFIANSVVIGKAIPGGYVSVESDNLSNGISVDCSPNPVSGAATVSIALGEAGEYSLDLVSMNGQRTVLADRRVSAEKVFRFALDGANLASGVYTLILRNGKSMVTKKIVIVN